jgi:hypothetical protein
MMSEPLAAISTARELWKQLVRDGGLQPSGWDRELVEALEIRLGRGLRTPLEDLLKVTPVEDLVLAILAELRPFGAMMAICSNSSRVMALDTQAPLWQSSSTSGARARATCTSTCVSSERLGTASSTQPRPFDGGIGTTKHTGNCSKPSGGACHQLNRSRRIRPLGHGWTNGRRNGGQIEAWRRPRRAIGGWPVAWPKSGSFGAPS